MFCSKCGKEIKEGKFCSYCGNPLTDMEENIQEQLKVNHTKEKRGNKVKKFLITLFLVCICILGIAAAIYFKDIKSDKFKMLIDSGAYSEAVTYYLDSIIENGVQLTHWWTFRSDRAGFNDPTSWRCDSGDVYNAIVAANKRIKETYIVNEVLEANTNNFWNDPYFDVIKTEDIVDGMSFIQDTSLKMKVKNVIITASALVLTAISLLIMSTTIKIKKKRTA